MKSHRRAASFVAATLLLVGLPAMPAAQQTSRAAGSSVAADPAAGIDAILAQWNRAGSPGAAVAVVREGEIVHSQGYGLANLEYDVPITPSSVFHIASVSKHFTAFAIGLLAQEGRLSLDDDIRKHLPEVPDFGRTVTIRHLIHHTSGMRDQWELLAMAGWRLDDVITREHILKMVSHQRELNFEPGAEYLYSNTGYSLLAEIVARVSGQPFARFTEERIFRPLGMKSTHFHDDHQRIVPNRAYSYTPGRSGYRAMPLNYANVGATSLFTTVEDLAKWERNFLTGQVGGKELLRQMLTRGMLNDGKEIPYAHGLIWGEHRGLPTVSHSGADAGYRTVYLRFPEQRLSVIVFSNLSSFNPIAVAHQVAESYLRDQLRPERPARDRRADTRTGDEGLLGAEPAAGEHAAADAGSEVVLSAAELAAFVGTYSSDELGTTYHLVLRDGRLIAEHRRHLDTPLSPTARDRFAGENWWFRSLHFSRDAAGRVDGFRLTGGRVRNLRFERVD
jgi:CubicO group peptidase (beta-lactamase class C family)